jgi:hypothetical protein
MSLTRLYSFLCLFGILTSMLFAQTNVPVNDVAMGTEVTNLIPGGSFESGTYGWNHIAGHVDTDLPPSELCVPLSSQSLTLQGYIDNNDSLGQMRREITIEGGQEMVISAYLWNLSDDTHKVNVVVVDLNDESWEGQLVLYSYNQGCRDGVFCYQSFTPPAGTHNVTLRCFYNGVTADDDNWPNYPVAAMWDNVAITPASVFEPPLSNSGSYPTGDINLDGNVNTFDLEIMAAEWLNSEGCMYSDANRDGVINAKDFNYVAEKWNNNEIQAWNQTLTGSVMCGYQGWFNCPDDGANRGWVHWGSSGRFEPGYCTIDLWPDVSEYEPDELFPSGFQYENGETAYVFSSYNRKTVLRHFKWMQDYNIDGAYLQRFATETYGGTSLNHRDTVLAHCKEAANLYKRKYVMMYDLSGLGETGTLQVIRDWKRLVDVYGLTKDPNDRAYAHHNGKPVIAVWGIGFKDRAYTLEECKALLNFFRTDPDYGGMTIMVGIPSYWRTLGADCVNDPYLFEVLEEADILSPWAVGRYSNTSGVNSYANNVWIPDMQWCNSNGKEYLPVVFPGFSWYNLHGGILDQIPRRGGQFLWEQYYKTIKDSGVSMVYQAMFDEVDEATAIFKCTNNPPVGSFIDYEGLPSDHYLWLVGQAGKMLRREIPATSTIPTRD